MSPATETDIIVLGAGPAGLSAAAAAADAGCQVVLIDAYQRPGGQYYKQLPPEFHSTRPQALQHNHAWAQQTFARLAAHSNVRMQFDTTVWAVEPSAEGFTFNLATEEGGARVDGSQVVLAPGAYERALPFPGWDLPGIMTAGAAQTLVKSQRVLPGRRVVLSGSGPFLLPVAALLAEGGAQVVAVCEATVPWRRAGQGIRVLRHPDKLREGLDYLRVLGRHRVPFRFGRAVVRAEGTDRVECATIARLTPTWDIVPGSEEVVAVDTVCIGYGFMPSTELSYQLGCAHRYDPVQAAHFVEHDASMESSTAGVFVAGEITGIGGAAAAIAQGAVAGLAAARRQGRLSEDEATPRQAPWYGEYRHQRRFADMLRDAFAIQPGWKSWVTAETVVCRCEEVCYGDIAAAVADHDARDVRAVKALTRAGMGFCQGRICMHAVEALTASLGGRSDVDAATLERRPIARPVTLADIAHSGVGD